MSELSNESLELALAEAERNNADVEQERIEKLIDGKRLLVAMPVYDGRVDVEVIKNIMSISECGVVADYYPLKGESLIQRARNTCFKFFLDNQEKYFGMIFIDSDVLVKPQDVVRLAVSGYDLIGAPVRIKSFDDLRYSVNYDESKKKEGETIVPVYELATGCMYLSAKLINDLKDNAEKNKRFYSLHYTKDEAGNYTPKSKYYDIARVFIHHVSGEYQTLLSEDYGICYDAIQLGYQPYVDFSIQTGHIGGCIYYGGMIETRLSQEEFGVLNGYKTGKEDIVSLMNKAKLEGDYDE